MPLRAFIAAPDVEIGRGNEISVAVIVVRENIANSVGLYAKHAVSLFKNTMQRAE
jgi:hypothetical protein